MRLPYLVMWQVILLGGIFAIGKALPAAGISAIHYIAAAGAFALLYAVYIYFSLGKNNHDFIVTEDTLQIVNRVPGFRSYMAVPLAEIEEIVFSEDHVNLESPDLQNIIREVIHHPERKWVEIRTSDVHMRYKCYGMEHAGDTDNWMSPTYDDFYHYLKQDRGLPVRRISESAA
ncbi:MAG: hypothetical protein AAF570_09580 [Bacteroidota bacterium]